MLTQSSFEIWKKLSGLDEIFSECVKGWGNTEHLEIRHYKKSFTQNPMGLMFLLIKNTKKIPFATILYQGESILQSNINILKQDIPLALFAIENYLEHGLTSNCGTIHRDYDINNQISFIKNSLSPNLN